MTQMTNDERRIFNGIVQWILDKDREPYLPPCEAKAEKEIKNLSDDARHHLQHLYRNFLQNVTAGIEMRNLESVRDSVWEASEKLRRLGL